MNLFGFTKQEYDIIRKLLKITKKVNVTVCTDSLILDKNPEIDIFYSNKQTAEKLMNIANEEDVKIINSPVGMPGRAICNSFIKKVEKEKCKIDKCYNCIKTCNIIDSPYCITKALINSVKGKTEDGLIFCGSNVSRIKEIVSVKDLMKELVCEL